MKQNNKKAVIYCRVASEKQSEGGSSLEVQEQVCNAFLKAKGYEVSEVIKETVSGANINRDGYKKLLKLIKNKKVGAICAYSIDRFTRNAKDGVSLLALLKKHRVEVVYADSPLRALAETLFTSYVQYEREAHRRRILAGLARKKSLLGSRASSTI